MTVRSMPCERCGGPAIGLPVRSGSGSNHGQIFVTFDKAPNARMFKDPYFGAVTAWVCRRCGYTTMWVDQHGLNSALDARDRALGKKRDSTPPHAVGHNGGGSGEGNPLAVPGAVLGSDDEH